MSSLTIPMRIRRLPASPPIEFDREAELAALAAGRDLGEEFGGLALGVAAKALGFPGQRIPVSALRSDSTNGLARRMWAVMNGLSSASRMPRAYSRALPRRTTPRS